MTAAGSRSEPGASARTAATSTTTAESGANRSAADGARVLEIVRARALEVGGPRAASAVTSTASLECDVGLGSLERVELVARFEDALGRELRDDLLLLDTPRDLARACAAAVAAGVPVVPVALRGARAVLRGGERLPHPGRIDVWIGEPLRRADEERDGWRAALDLCDRAATAIAAHCGEPRLGSLPSVEAPLERPRDS
ncbi:MAG: acyl carrier protein [Gemmatimonadaceae bacterium]